VVNEAVRVLKQAVKNTGVELNFKEYLAGGCAIDKIGMPLPYETLRDAKASDAVLSGRGGRRKVGYASSDMRPENALLGLRSGLELFANLRPAILLSSSRAPARLSPSLPKTGLTYS
jgi:3-isopropylmalate dehydrogenase